jgi:hypothetical protein
VARLEEAGVAAAEGVRARPALLYARVKHEAGPLGWRRLLVKYPLFGVLVGSILFDAHQRIAYGGPFGQWELEGALAWLRTLVAHWAAVTLYLALYASLWRWPAEILAWLAARRGTVLATRVRRLVEVACRVAYYAGVPLLLALLYAQSA